MTGRPGQTRPLAKEKGKEENIWRRNILGQRKEKEERRKYLESLTNSEFGLWLMKHVAPTTTNKEFDFQSQTFSDSRHHQYLWYQKQWHPIKGGLVNRN